MGCIIVVNSQESAILSLINRISLIAMGRIMVGGTSILGSRRNGASVTIGEAVIYL